MIIKALETSLKISTIAVLISLLISLILIYKNKLKKNKLIETLILLPIFIPPSALGYIVLITLGKQGIIGQFLDKHLNLQIIFTMWAAIIVSVIVTLPIMYQSIKMAVNSIEKEIIESAKICGANNFEIFTKIILPLSKKGIYTGILLSFARSFGEFGATILVAGNIPGKTQTLPMAMYYAIESNQNQLATNILILILIIALILISIYKFLENKND